MMALGERVLAAAGRVDVLFNNAGVMTAGPFEQITLEEWQRVLGVNFWGVLHGVRAFLPAMIARRAGYIVNTSSMAGLVGLPQVSAYLASKHAVVGLTSGLVAELGAYGIGVTLVCPGATRTNIMHSGPMNLPFDAAPKLRAALARWAPRPEALADKVLDAVWHRRPLVATGLDMLPLWWFSRMAPTLYLRLVHALGVSLGR
jgi:NAD(P)-dependent dehydrogenase (short-subunit alcohol dehydrogenase family)